MYYAGPTGKTPYKCPGRLLFPVAPYPVRGLTCRVACHSALNNTILPTSTNLRFPYVKTFIAIFHLRRPVLLRFLSIIHHDILISIVQRVVQQFRWILKIIESRRIFFFFSFFKWKKISTRHTLLRYYLSKRKRRIDRPSRGEKQGRSFVFIGWRSNKP